MDGDVPIATAQLVSRSLPMLPPSRLSPSPTVMQCTQCIYQSI